MSDGGACVCQAVLEAGWAVGGCVQGGDGDGGVLRLLEIEQQTTRSRVTYDWTRV